MKIPFLATASVSLFALTWLGLSFATPTEAPDDPRYSLYAPEIVVGPDHPDSHRLGKLATEEVPLPVWNKEPSLGEVALITK